MNRFIQLSLGAGLVLGLAACAPVLTPAAAPTAPQSTARPASTPQPATPAPTSELFLAQPQGAAGPLLAYDMANGALRFSLPAGLLSADRQHYLAAKMGADTQVLAYDLATGAEKPLAQLAGQWALSAVSPSGHWAALTRIPTEAEKQAWTAADDWQTEVQMLDVTTGQAAQPIELAGNFAVDTLSPPGDALFVIQYLPAVKPDHYQVRLYDLTTGTLQDGALVDKREADEVMAGERWQAVAPSDGSWLFTLYLRPTDNTAFIHALDTVNKYTLCFDLPAVDGSTLDQLRAYTLALAPGGQALYAANPALGVIDRIDLGANEVSRVASFVPEAALAGAAPLSFGVAGQRMMYFTGGQQIWAFDATTASVKRLSALDSAIAGLGLGRDGGQLFVARTGQPPVTLDTASGEALGLQ